MEVTNYLIKLFLLYGVQICKEIRTPYNVFLNFDTKTLFATLSDCPYEQPDNNGLE